MNPNTPGAITWIQRYNKVIHYLPIRLPGHRRLSSVLGKDCTKLHFILQLALGSADEFTWYSACQPTLNNPGCLDGSTADLWRPVSSGAAEPSGGVRVRSSGVRVRATGVFVSVPERQESVPVPVRQESVSVSVRQESVSMQQGCSCPCPSVRSLCPCPCVRSLCPCPCVRMERRLLLVPLLLLVGCADRPDTHSLVSAVPRHLAVCLSVWTPQCLSAACLDTCMIDHSDAVIRQPEGHRVEVALSPSMPPLCPEHWLRYDDSCYLIPSEHRTWMAANHACARLDRRARLASIHRDNIQHVAGVLNMATEAWRVWVGLVRISSDPSTFGWTDGTPFDVSNWSENEPNNINNTEHCVHLQGVVYGEKERYKWSDVYCFRIFRFLCQINLAS